jgi:hypothetical protein
MKMTPPTRTEVAQRAHEIWASRGSPLGLDSEIWLDAERQLSAGPGREDSGVPAHRQPLSEPKTAAATAERLKGEMASESAVEFHISPPISDQAAIKAALQKREARAPQLPTHIGPKGTPPESGKPLWNQPHSS